MCHLGTVVCVAADGSGNAEGTDVPLAGSMPSEEDDGALSPLIFSYFSDIALS
jgi:hypothetical protein